MTPKLYFARSCRHHLTRSKIRRDSKLDIVRQLFGSIWSVWESSRFSLAKWIQWNVAAFGLAIAMMTAASVAC